MKGEHYDIKENGFYIQSFPIFISYTKDMCIANFDMKSQCFVHHYLHIKYKIRKISRRVFG